MRLTIRHTTSYGFSQPATHGLQRLRLTPKPTQGQQVLDWSMEFDGVSLEAEYDDHHRNRTTLVSMQPGASGVTVTCVGIVDTADQAGVLGKHSGRAALADRAKALGFQLTGGQLQTVFDEFKKLADKKKEVYDGDIAALIEHELHGVAEEQWQLVSFEMASGSGHKPSVKLTLRRGSEDQTVEMSDGDGPIDCAFLATEKITGYKLTCQDYQVRSATLGHDALGDVTLEVEYNGQTIRGRGVSTDTVEATVMAILNAVNRIAQSEKRRT